MTYLEMVLLLGYGSFSLPMWINKSPIWTNPFLPIGPFLLGKYKPILGLIFIYTESFFSSQKREKEQFFRSQNSALTANFKLRFPFRFLSDWDDFWITYYLHLNILLGTERVGFGGLQLQFFCVNSNYEIGDFAPIIL